MVAVRNEALEVLLHRAERARARHAGDIEAMRACLFDKRVPQRVTVQKSRFA
jgi:hypothetical protein